MNSGSSLRTGRALALLFAPLLFLGTALCGSAANSLRGPRTAAPAAPRMRFEVPLNKVQPGDLPLQRISMEQAQAWAAQTLGSRNPRATAPPPPATTPQFLDLTTTPRPPLVGISTLCQEIQPAWSWDQQTIYFASNNVDPVASYGQTRPAASALFHIYQMTSDGAFIQQITGTGNNPNATDEPAGTQLYPAINHAQTKLAYAHRPNPASPFELYVLTFSTDPAVPPRREQLTGLSDPGGFLGFNSNIVNVEHPSWDPGDNFITFSARNKSVTGDVRNIYAVNIVSKVVYQVTHGTPANGVEAIDPVFHPSAAVGRITFAANTGNPANGGAINPATGDLNYVANPLKDLRRDGSPDDVDHNLFTVPFTTSQLGASASAPMQQLTTDVADDIEPAYEQSVYPPGQGVGSFNNYLAWSSLGRLPNNQAGRNSYDIYFNNGFSESASTPIRLFTPDTNAGAVPLHLTDERYPTWSSALPPQNPIDRIAFSSNRQNNTADLTKPLVGPAGDTDIWAAEVTDITPPTLFPISDYAADLKAQFPAQDFSFLDGEVLHIANAPLPQQGRRIGVPRDTMYFYTKLKDLQYGIDTVWIQIKDPDGPSTDIRGQNHKLYGQDTINPDGTLATTNNVFPVRWRAPLPTPTHFQEQAFETDYEGVSATDAQYFAAPKRIDPATFGIWTRYASKAPGVDDSVRWSGNQTSIFNPGVLNSPPVDANNNPLWLQLKDDGVAPDLVAGDGIYSAKWMTPDDPSDFYVDLIAYDKAFNPKAPNQQGNWIMYDNIWGFSTQPFSSKNPVLLVDDNGAGQKWPRGLKGSFRTFPTFRLGTESDIMDRPDQFNPREAYTDANDGGRWHTAITTPLGGTAVGSSVPTFHFLDGDSISYDFINWARGALRAYRADLWRILAKGPITQTVLNDYVPTRDPQPADDRGVQPFIQRPVPRRAVVWSAPYTGDIFSGGGTILDQTTQTLLTDYKSKAGRLVVAGGDILWAMTVDGTQSLPFATNVLGANYTGDLVRPDFATVGGGPIARAITHDAADSAFNNLPGPPPYWAPDWQISLLGFASFFSVADVPVRQHPNAAGNAEYTYNTDGTPFQTQDGVTAASGFEQVTANRVVAQDDFGNTNSKTVFMSGSLASLGRRYTSVGDQGAQQAGNPPPQRDPLDCMNVKARLSHALFCWMFSADLVGQIKNLNGGAPISGAFVTLTQGNRTVGTAFSKADGTYTVRGLPVGNWTIEVKVPGFATIKKDIGSGAHGLVQAQADVFLTPAAPGSISGKVTDQFGQPVPNTTVQAHLLTNGLYTGQVDFFVVTQADGTYLFPNLPTGDYEVMVTKLPTGFANPTPAKLTVTVNAAQNTPNADFTVTGGGAGLTVFVFNQLPDGTKGSPVSGVSVDVLDNSGAKLNGTTDSAGRVTFNNVAPGPATVTAFLANFQEASKKVTIPQDSQVEILLATAAHPVNLYGLVKRAADAQPLAGTDVTPAVTLQLLRKASQLPLPGVTADVFAPPATTPVPNNYRFSNAQEGLYTLSFPGNSRFNPASVDVNIGSNTDNQAPDLLLVGKDGTLKGKVVDNTGAPVVGATVQLVSSKPAAGTVVLTLTTAADGTFASDPTKLITSDVYDLQVQKFGYTSAVVKSLLIAGDTDAGTITLQRGQRGKVFGLVTRSTDSAPLDGVTVQFFSNLGGSGAPQKVAETTSVNPPVNGPDNSPINYSIGDVNQAADLLPAGTYQVRVTGDPRFASFSQTITVTSGSATRVDISLTPLPGAITGFVRDPNGKAISGATVTVNGKSVTTDSTGKYVTASLQPGQYTVSASAFAFQNNSVSVFVMGPTTAPDIVLQPVPPSSVSGTVRSRADNSAVSGVLIEFLDAGGNVVASTTSTGTLSGSPLSNFQLTVPPGTYTVRATKNGWNTATLTSIKVNPNVALTNLSILLDAEHTFGRGLVMMSLPYDYPGVDAATVLGQDPSTFKAAWYNPLTNSYDIYPNGGAREFRLGKALFVRLANPTPFANAANGVPAPAVPFVIDLPKGWNMIGAVRKVPISWVNVRVRTPDGQERTMQEAYAANIIQNGLWLYQDGYFQTNTLQPYQGYFVKALTDCSLVIPVDNSSASAGSANLKRLAGAPTAAQVAAELRAAGLAPESYGMGLPAALQAAPVFPAGKPNSNPWPAFGAFTRPDAWLPRALRG